MGVTVLGILIFLPLIISLLVFYLLKKLLLKKELKSSKVSYILLILLWIAMFIYLSIKVYGDQSLVNIWYMLALITLSAPLGFLAIVFLNLSGFIFRFDSNLVFYSLFLVSLFLSGYYQWFIWFPKYLKRKEQSELLSL